MNRLILCVVVSCCAVSAFGQGYVPYTPGSTANVPQYVPQQPPVQTQPPLPYSSWSAGMRESWSRTDTHDIRPLYEQENMPYTPPAYQYQQQPAQQYYYQQPTQQYYCPQPQQQYYYRQPCQQYYYQPQWYYPQQQRCFGLSW